MNYDVPIITVDGVGASGKGTVASMLAERLGYNYINTGVFYRLAAHKMKERGLPLEHSDELIEITKNLVVDFKGKEIIHEGKDIWPHISTEEVGRAATSMAHIVPFRETIDHNIKTNHIKFPGAVVDGRASAEVLPHAKLKIFLHADAEARARRRHGDEVRKGTGRTYEEVLEDLKYRDHQNLHRDHYKTLPAKDAIVIDTTHLTPEQVVEIILKNWEKV